MKIRLLLALTFFCSLLTLFPLTPLYAQGRPDILWMAGGHSDYNRQVSNYVRQVKYSPDGQILASGSADHTIKLWRVADGMLLRTLAGVTTDFYSIAFSPDGQTLASGGGDGTITLWRISDGTLLRTINGHSFFVLSIAFSPDGQMLASAGINGTFKLWRVSDGTLLRTLTGHTSSVNSVAFSPDGQTLASGGGDKTIKLWRVSDGTLLRTLTGHTASVTSVAFSSDGQTLASSSIDSALGRQDGTIKLWRVSDGTLLKTLTGHYLPFSIAFSPDGQTLASSNGPEIKIWLVSDGMLLKTYDQETGDGTISRMGSSLTYSPDGFYFAYGRDDATVVVARNPFAPGTIFLSGVAPRRTLPTAEVALTLTGFGFVEGSTLRLRKTGATDLIPSSPLRIVHMGRALADFRFINAVPGRYDVVLTRPDGKTATLPKAFEIVPVADARPELSASLSGPATLRPGRAYAGAISFSNNGLLASSAPLLMVQNDKGVSMRLSPNDPWSDTVFVAAGGTNGRQLRPGETMNIPLHFVAPELPSHDHIKFTVKQVTGVKPEASDNNWALLESRVRPADIDPVAWGHIWNNFTGQIGTDGDSLLSKLASTSGYLAQYGGATPNASRLLNFAGNAAFGTQAPVGGVSVTDIAVSAPGSSLSFGRAFPVSIDDRFRGGVLGRGWKHGYDIRLNISLGKATITYSDGGVRVFHGAEGSNRWLAERGDYGTLVNDTIVEGPKLLEKDGTIVRFQLDGKLRSIQRGTFLTEVEFARDNVISVRVNGNDTLKITLNYNGAGFLETASDTLGHTVHYTYTGDELTSVTSPSGAVDPPPFSLTLS